MTPSPPRIRVSRMRRLRGRIRGVVARSASLAVQQFITRNRRVGFLLSLATVLWLIALRRENVEITAWEFFKVGLITMPLALLASVIFLLS